MTTNPKISEFETFNPIRASLVSRPSLSMPQTPPRAMVIPTPSTAWADIWVRAEDRLRTLLGQEVFNSWFGSLRLEEVNGGRARLSISTRFLKSWIEAHYMDKMLTVLAAECPGVVAVEIFVRSNSVLTSFDAGDMKRYNNMASSSPTIVALSESKSLFSTQGEPKTVMGSPLDRRLTFTNFISGEANQLALTLATNLAEGQPGAVTPIFFHGGVGLGKTHLLQATAHEAITRGREVVYFTAEYFMGNLVNALRSHTALQFKERLRKIDILIFDDVQFLQGRVMQSEFGHILNSLMEAGKHIVIAADRPPAELESVDERVRSRLAGGTCVELKYFDEPLRLQILEARLALARQLHPQFELSQEVLQFVVSAVATNGRDLEGALNRLLAYAQVNVEPVSVTAAEMAIRDLVRCQEPKRVRIEDIQKRVANHYNISRADLLSSRRTTEVVRPRQVAMYLAKVLTTRSLPEIGRRFGGRDHTTVLHSIRKIEALYSTNSKLRDEVELLRHLLQE